MSYQSTSLYVGDIQPEVSEAKLFEVFRNSGPIASIRVCRDTITKKSLGYAYVNFQKPEDAERALDLLNYEEINGKQMRIMWSQRDPSIRKSGVGNIFIKNLEKTIDHKALFDTFSAFGNILSCKVCTKNQTVEEDGQKVVKPVSLGYGFVHFETQESAEQAIEKVDGMLLNGKKVYVGPFIKKTERTKGEDIENVFTNLYVKNLDKSIDDEKLREIFSEFGKIQNAAVMFKQNGESKGFGFVNFLNHDDAVKAIEKFSQKEVDEEGKLIYVARAQDKEERRKVLAEKFSNSKQAPPKGNNLYLKNLDDSITDEQLIEAFNKFGKIVSAKVMFDDKGQSKGFGFICFSTPEEAETALSQMSQSILSGKPLYVSHAQKKEDRTKMLENKYSNPRVMYNQMQSMAYPIPMPVYQQNIPPHFIPRYGGYPPNQGGRRMSPFAGGAPMQGNHFSGRGRGGKRNMSNKSQKGYKITPNARNYPNEHGMQQGMNQDGQPIPQENFAKNISMNFLADKSEEEQKQFIGDRIYPTISEIVKNQEISEKVAGMILEMDTSDLLHLIDTPEELNQRIKEAINSLQS